MDGIVGILAFTTLGLVVLGVAFFYIRSLRESRNSDAAKNVFVEDGSSATTAVRGKETPDHLK